MNFMHMKTVAVWQRKLTEAARNFLHLCNRLSFECNRRDNTHANVHEEEKTVELICSAHHLVFAIMRASRYLHVFSALFLYRLSSQKGYGRLALKPGKPHAVATHQHIEREVPEPAHSTREMSLGE